MLLKNNVINVTKKWIADVVIGCNFCPFAATVFLKDNVYYFDNPNKNNFDYKKDVIAAINYIIENNIETAFIIYSNNYTDFNSYLNMYNAANNLLVKNKLAKNFQLASFHPQYIFNGAKDNDAANYTNRSPYPMLHILREASLTKAIKAYTAVDKIPANNIAFANNKGLAYMQNLLSNCFANNKV
jgi:uncharacterized protein